MDYENPYAAPKVLTETSQADEQGEQAGRLTRFFAQFIDGLIVGVLLAVLGAVIAIITMTIDKNWIFDFLKHGKIHQYRFYISSVTPLIIFLLFWLINFSRMRDSGQTIGKRMLGIKVVMENGDSASLSAQFKRYSLYHCAKIVPVIGNIFTLVDTLFIFRDSRQCLHDNFGKTKVIKA